jgi:histidinol dehydrogenase
MEAACTEITPADREAIDAARERIEAFHAREARSSWDEEREDGAAFGQRILPLERVGIYAPGGAAPYPSSVLMAGVPARLAGVREAILATPPQRDGGVDPHVLYAASICEIDTVYRIGGAQAIAAFAYGTESVPRVDKIVGPGNAFVNAAKRSVFGSVGIDALAGPSELVVLADETAPADWVAADLLSQAEHDEDATCVLITAAPELASDVVAALSRRIDALLRGETARRALEERGAILVTRDLSEGVDLCNRIAPEHLEVLTRNPRGLLPRLRHAAMILLGGASPVAACDYGAGPNHILPTGGTARFASPLGIDDFVVRSNVMSLSPAALDRESESLRHLAGIEGFQGHAEAIAARKEEPDEP